MEGMEFKAPSGLTKGQAAKDLGRTDEEVKFVGKDEVLADWVERFRDEKLREVAEEEWRRTGLDGTRGEIICIGWAVGDKAPKTVMRHTSQPEKVLLQEFWHELQDQMEDRKPVWVGHNICGFDLRFMWHRSVINSVLPVYDLRHNAKPWTDGVIDTLYDWKGDNKAGGSLDKICKAFGLEGKGDIDGSQVWDYIKAGRYDEVAAYCRDDVEKTRAIHKRMAFIGS
jgi:predicted PolB exonuclease-like 3'-5' exonuclease